MKRNESFKPSFTSLLLTLLLTLVIFTIIFSIFYLYHEGVWRKILAYYRYFFEANRLQKFIVSFGPYASFIFVFVQSLQVFLAPIPGEVTGFVGGLLFGKVIGTILSIIGLLAGSLFAFGLSRVFGMELVQKVVKREYVDRFNHFITHGGLHLSFVLFLIPGFPKDSLCYLLGISRMRYRDFIIINVFGRLPGTLVLAWQGDAVRSGKYQEFFVLLLGSVILILALFLARNYIVRFLTYSIHLVFGKKRGIQ